MSPQWNKRKHWITEIFDPFMFTILTSRSVAEMLGAMWFSDAFKGNIQVGPNVFGPTWIVPACFIQTSVASKEKSWKRPVCIKANQWEPLCLSLPQLSCLSLLDRSLLFIFPWTVWSAFVTCDVSPLVICSCVQRKLWTTNYSSTLPPSKHW